MPLASAAPALTPDGQPGYAVRVHPLTALVIRALTEHADEAELVDVAQYIVPDGTARQNDKRPAKLTFLCPDEVIKSLRGEPRLRGKLLAVWIPAVVLEDLTRVVQTPAEAAANGAPLIVTP